MGGDLASQAASLPDALIAARIDAALSAYGRAVPAPGLESRVATRIAAAPRRSFRKRGGFGLLIWQRLSCGALAAAAGAAMVVGTVRHSRPAPLPQAARAAQSGGASAAGAVHIPTRAIPQSAALDPASPRSAPRSRATVSRNPSRRNAGSAATRSPYPPPQASQPQQ
jgi:hypothetical protein